MSMRRTAAGVARPACCRAAMLVAGHARAGGRAGGAGQRAAGDRDQSSRGARSSRGTTGPWTRRCSWSSSARCTAASPGAGRRGGAGAQADPRRGGPVAGRHHEPRRGSARARGPTPAASTSTATSPRTGRPPAEGPSGRVRGRRASRRRGAWCGSSARVRPTAVLSFHQAFDLVDISHPRSRPAGRHSRPADGGAGRRRPVLRPVPRDHDPVGRPPDSARSPSPWSSTAGCRRAEADRAAAAVLRLGQWLGR